MFGYTWKQIVLFIVLVALTVIFVVPLILKGLAKLKGGSSAPAGTVAAAPGA